VLHFGKVLALHVNIRLGRKGFPETNTLAYLPTTSVTKTSFVTSTLKVTVTIFFFVTDREVK